MADYPFLDDIFSGRNHLRNAQWEIEAYPDVAKGLDHSLNKATAVIIYIRLNYNRSDYVNVLFCPSQFRSKAKEIVFILEKQVSNKAYLALSVCDFYRVLRVTFPEKFKDFNKEEK